MKTAIILGFSYSNCKTDSINYNLPGILLDLYAAYNYCSSIACDKVIIITDETDDRNNYILDLVVTMKVDRGVTTFLEDLKMGRQVLEFMNLDNFHANLIPFVRNANKLIFYYSGHAHHGMALIPKYKHRASYDLATSQSSQLYVISFIELLKPIILATDSNCEVLTILDCCSSEALYLPYELVLKIKREGASVLSPLEEVSSGAAPSAFRGRICDFSGCFRLSNLENWFGTRSIAAIAVTNSTFSSHSGSNFTAKVVAALLDDAVFTFPSLVLRLSVELSEDEKPPDRAPMAPGPAKSRAQLKCSYPVFAIQPWMKRATKISITYDSGYHVYRISN